MAIYIKPLLATVALSLSVGCTFFEQPVDDLRVLAPSLPTNEETTQQPVATLTPIKTNPTTAAPPATAPNNTATASGSYLVVAPIESLPEQASNVAVVHFTKKDTKRALELCKALFQQLEIIDIQELPAQAANVVLWPVANDNAGGSCIEMLTDYEPIDITVDASKRINESADGPFLLTQHMPTGQRMIYDMSFLANSALDTAARKWKSLLSDNPADWPPYRRAR